MTRDQIYTVLNSVQKQAFGQSAIVATPTTWVSVGEQALADNDTKETWLNTIWDVIGRTVIAIRVLRAQEDGLYRDPMEFGAMLRKISYGDVSASENATWTDGSESPFERFPFTAYQTIFKKISTWEFDLSLPSAIQMETAFHNEQEMGAFFEGYMTALNNAVEMAIINAANMCRVNFIAMRINENKGMTSRNLLSEYNAANGTTLTAAKCLNNVDFLLYVVGEIQLAYDRMKYPNQQFSNGQVTRFANEDAELHMYTLANLDSALARFLVRESYNTSGIGLPEHRKVPYWQGAGTDYAFSSVSTVSITRVLNPEATTPTETTITQSGVIALIADREAMAITVDKRRLYTIFNPRKEFTNYFAKADIGYMNDLSEMGVVFYVADEAEDEEKEG